MGQAVVHSLPWPASGVLNEARLHALKLGVSLQVTVIVNADLFGTERYRGEATRPHKLNTRNHDHSLVGFNHRELSCGSGKCQSESSESEEKFFHCCLLFSKEFVCERGQSHQLENGAP